MVKYKPSLWLHYVDDTLMVQPHGTITLHDFFQLINSLRMTTIYYGNRNKQNDSISGQTYQPVKTYTNCNSSQKQIHTVHCLNHCSNNPSHVKKGVIQNLSNRDITICQQKHDLTEEADKLKRGLLLCGYPHPLHQPNSQHSHGNQLSKKI